MLLEQANSAVPLRKIDDVAMLSGALPIDLNKDYNYQKALTPHLDKQDWVFSEVKLLEIALWKVNRYINVSDDLIDLLNRVKADPSHENATQALEFMLADECFGIDLPMASTMLRFASPKHFQIVDQRVFRFIMPSDMVLNLRLGIDQKIALYFDYLERFRSVTQRYSIEFEKSDRILYLLDKRNNKDLPIH